MSTTIKENLLFAFTLSLIASYSFSVGFYSHFNLDITTYLTLQDLTLIFAKWIWLTLFFLVYLLIFILREIKKSPAIEKKKETWWNKTIGNTIYKRRVLILLPLSVALIILIFVYEIVALIFTSVIGLIFFILIIVVTVDILLKSIKKTPKLTELSYDFWWSLLFLSVIFCFVIPLASGGIVAKNISPQKLYVKFSDGNTLNTSNSSIIYIGKTSGYFFTYNKELKSTTSYNMSLVTSFEVRNK